MTRAKNRVFFYILSILTVFLFFFLLKSPVQAGESISEGIMLCLSRAIPSLFPFFVLNELMISLGFPQRFGKLFGNTFAKLFHIRKEGASAFVSGCLFGFPLGTKTVVSLYEKDLISKNEAEKLVCFCSNTGPAFILGIVGTGVCNKKIAICIYLCQIISALLVGFAIRGKAIFQVTECTVNNQDRHFSVSAVTKAITDSVLPMFNVCAFICFFSCISGTVDNILTRVGFGEYSSLFLTGFLEITKGVELTSNYGTNFLSVFLCAFFVGWSGISVILQSISLTSKHGLSSKKFILSKLAQGGICAVICTILCNFLKLY